MNKWVLPIYADRRLYNAAGRALVAPTSDKDKRDESIEIVSNWRAAHRYPLHSIMMGLRQRAKSVDANAIVVQRLKRIPSIIPKLERGLNLTQIQDIGGCRAVIRDIRRFDQLHLRYLDRLTSCLDGKSYLNGEPNDYVTSPKEDGYRGIHYVFRYLSETEEYKCFDDMKIEIQIRTNAQHIWATAVEIVDFFTDEGLKTDIDRNQSTPQWKRFFKLMGNVIAFDEERPLVPGTPTDRRQLISELRDLCKAFHIIDKLEGYSATVTRITTSQNAPKSGAYLVVLNVDKRTLRIMSYNQAADNYLRKEREYLENPLVQVLQADASSLNQLMKAYPNYELDTKEFVDTVKKALQLKA
jgi:hypothetical protein